MNELGRNHVEIITHNSLIRAPKLGGKPKPTKMFCIELMMITVKLIKRNVTTAPIY